MVKQPPRLSTPPYNEHYRLSKIIRQNGGSIYSMKMAPRDSICDNLVAVVASRGLYVYDSNVLEQGHLDLISHLSMSIEEPGPVEWIIVEDDALIAVVINCQLWIVSMALSKVIHQKTLRWNPIEMNSDSKGILHLINTNGERLLFNHIDGNLSPSTNIQPIKNLAITWKRNVLCWDEFELTLSNPIGVATITSVTDQIAVVGFITGDLCIIDKEGVIKDTLHFFKRSSAITAIVNLSNGRILAADNDGSLWLHVPKVIREEPVGRSSDLTRNNVKRSKLNK